MRRGQETSISTEVIPAGKRRTARRLTMRACAMAVTASLLVVVSPESATTLAQQAEPNNDGPSRANSSKGIPGVPGRLSHPGTDVDDLPLKLDRKALSPVEAVTASAAQAPALGEARNWLALDFSYGFLYPKQFTLRGVGEHIEVWVASELNVAAPANPNYPQVGQSSDLDYLDGDCRNGVRTQVTDEQIDHVIDQFDGNIYPTESAVFSVAPDRDGTNSTLPPDFFNPQGDGDSTVVLVDNIRDDNFYDFNNSQNLFDVGGIFSRRINELLDRNVMTLEGFDWLHRTGINPPNDPVPGDNCANATAAPSFVEAVSAHEYQHLLEYYEDPDESAWVNEGLSEFAMVITGYKNSAISIDQIGFDYPTQCFLGWIGVQTPANPIPAPGGGPENSLTVWGDQPDAPILCDYGAASTFMQLLAGRYGTDVISQLHREDANGLQGLQNVLDGLPGGIRSEDVLHDWTLMVALDGLIDDGANVSGVSPKDITTPTLHATINWDIEEAYATPGAPPNGSDYVRLRDASGQYLEGDEIESLSFDGSRTFPTQPVQWTIDANPPFQTGDAALYSGVANLRDEMIVRQISVPTGAQAELSFDALWNEEELFDYDFVQISTDDGATYASLTCTDTTDVADDSAHPVAIQNVPGFTGFSGGWRPQTCSLAAYAGQNVLLAFRSFQDFSVLGTEPSVTPGFWVDDISVGGTLISDGTSLSGWQSRTEARPIPVAGFTVNIVSIRTDNKDNKEKISVRQLPLTDNFTLDGGVDVRSYIDKKASFVAAIVFHDDPSETSTDYAPYNLAVNGATQPGGGL